MNAPDPKPPARVKDARLLKRLHREWQECEMCGSVNSLSLHHILNKPRDDVRGNLMMLCGSGSTGCHGSVTAERQFARHTVATIIVENRADAFDFLVSTLGAVAAQDWLDRRLL